MEKTKTKNKKFFIAIISLSVALICALGAIIGIWAATSQAVKSSFSVRYNVDGHVAARVTSFYQVIGDTELTQIDQTTFNVWDDNTTPTQHNGPSITFDPANGKTAVRFIYIFENLSEETISFTPNWDIATNIMRDGDTISDFWQEGDANKNVTISGDYYYYSSLESAKEAFTSPDGEFYEFDLVSPYASVPYQGIPTYIEPGNNDFYAYYIEIVLGNPNKSAYVYSNSDYSMLTFDLNIAE